MAFDSMTAHEMKSDKNFSNLVNELTSAGLSDDEILECLNQNKEILLNNIEIPKKLTKEERLIISHLGGEAKDAYIKLCRDIRKQ